MTNAEAIQTLKLMQAQAEWDYPMDYAAEVAAAIDLAIEALDAQDSKTRRICDTCKHNPPSKKWPCVDCDMRNPADRWEPKEVKNSKESSITRKGLDTISRQAALDVIRPLQTYKLSEGDEMLLVEKAEVQTELMMLPSAQPEIIYCKDCKYHHRDNSGAYYCERKEYGYGWGLNDFCSDAERRTDE